MDSIVHGLAKSGTRLSGFHFHGLNSSRAEVNGMYMLCYAKLLQSCPSLCNPIDGNPPGSPVPGFSRQEHWRGLPFPSPIHESEK